MALSSGWFKLTEYLDEVVAEGLNQSTVGIAPQGRYSGFDSLQSAPSGTGIPIKIAHTTKTKFSDKLNVLQEQAMIITPHGVVIYTDNELIFDIPSNAGYPNAKVYLIYIRYSWVESEGGSLPLASYLDVTSSPGTPEEQVPDDGIDLPIGYLTVAIGGSSIANCVWEPFDSPAFGDNPLDISQFAKRDEENIFLETQGHKVQEVDATGLQGGGLVFQQGNVVELDITLDGVDIEIASLVDAANIQGAWFYVNVKSLTLLNQATLKFISGGNISWPNNVVPHDLVEGHTYIFYRTTTVAFTCMGAYGEVSRRMYDVESLAALNASTLTVKAGLGDHNKFTKLQQWAQEETSVIDSSGCIVIQGTGNQVVFYGDASDIEVKGIKVNSDYIEHGTMITISFVDVGPGSKFIQYPGGSVPGFMLPDGFGEMAISLYSEYTVSRYKGAAVYPTVASFNLWPDIDAINLIASPWVTVTPGSSFDFTGIAAADQLKYRRILGNRVEFVGEINCSVSSGLLITTLDPAFYPSLTNISKIVTEDTSTFIQLIVATDGQVLLLTPATLNNNIKMAFDYPLD